MLDKVIVTWSLSIDVLSENPFVIRKAAVNTPRLLDTSVHGINDRWRVVVFFSYLDAFHLYLVNHFSASGGQLLLGQYLDDQVMKIVRGEQSLLHQKERETYAVPEEASLVSRDLTRRTRCIIKNGWSWCWKVTWSCRKNTRYKKIRRFFFLVQKNMCK